MQFSRNGLIAARKNLRALQNTIRASVTSARM